MLGNMTNKRLKMLDYMEKVYPMSSIIFDPVDNRPKLKKAKKDKDVQPSLLSALSLKHDSSINCNISNVPAPNLNVKHKEKITIPVLKNVKVANKFQSRVFYKDVRVSGKIYSLCVSYWYSF